MRIPGTPPIDLDVGVLGTRGGERESSLCRKEGRSVFEREEGDEQEKDYGVPISLTEAYA